MPRDGLQQYAPPPGTQGIPNFSVESARYNTFVADITQDQNNPRPIVAGGTGGSTPDGALDNLSAEKFKMVVTDYGTMVWRAGSFYSASSATAPPVAGHAFAGIAYYANATDFVLEATDLTDTSNPVPYIRVMASGVWGPWTRLSFSNTAGSQIGEFTFDTGITFPPASGTVRLNNATQNSATEIFISHLTANGVDVTTSLPFVLRVGYELSIADKSDITKYKIFTITAAPVLSGSDIRVLATFRIGGVDLTASRVLLNTTNPPPAPPAPPRSYLAGLTLSTAGGSTSFTAQPGVATDSTNVVSMTLAAAITKTNAAWAVGSAAGGLDTGATTASTWYHVFLIRRPDTGVVDVLFSLNATTPTLPASYTQFRRIGSIYFNTLSQWAGFTQVGDTFLWTAPVLDYNGSLTTTPTLMNLSVPSGLNITAIFGGAVNHSSIAGFFVYFSSPLQNTSPVNIGSLYTPAATGSAAGLLQVITNTSQQIYAQVGSNTATNTVWINTFGWIDTRGRNN